MLNDYYRRSILLLCCLNTQSCPFIYVLIYKPFENGTSNKHCSCTEDIHLIITLRVKLICSWLNSAVFVNGFPSLSIYMSMTGREREGSLNTHHTRTRKKTPLFLWFSKILNSRQENVGKILLVNDSFFPFFKGPGFEQSQTPGSRLPVLMVVSSGGPASISDTD